MAVEVVQKNTNSGKINYIDAAAIGAIGGYTLKWAIPITPQEKDKRYNTTLVAIEKKNLDGVDVYIRLQDEKKLSPTEIKQIKQILSEKFNNNVLKTKELGKQVLVSFTKSIRPTKTFLLLGTGLTVGTAIIYNIFKEIAKDSKKNK